MNRIGIVAMIWLTSTVSAAAADVGDWVAFTGDTDLKIQYEVVATAAIGDIFRVTAVNGPWLMVQSSRPGWAPSTSTIPIDQAIEYFTTAIQQNPYDASQRIGIAGVYSWQRKFGAALSSYNAAIQLDPYNANTYYSRGICWARQSDFARALTDFDEYLRRGGSDDYIFRCGRGDALSNLRQWDKAVADYNMAMRLNPKSSRPLVGRAQVYEAQGDYARALSDFTTAIALNPNNADIYIARGQCYRLAKEIAKAEADLAEAVRLAPTDFGAYTERGGLAYNLGHYDRAQQDLSAAAELGPTNPEALQLYAWFMATCRDEKYRNGGKAFTYAAKACELSHWKDASAINTLAAAYAEQADFPNAIKYVEQAIGLTTEDLKPYLQAHLDLYQQNKPLRAH